MSATARSSPALHRVFVYGSLLPGEENHRVLRGGTWLAEAATLPCFRLFDLGPYPALLGGGATSVQGAVFAVDTRLLARLDRFEDHPRLYRRVVVPLQGDEEAFGYVFVDEPQASSMPAIESGCWRTHRQQRTRATGRRINT